MTLYATVGDMASGTIRSRKACLVRLDWQEIAGAVVLFADNAVRPTHAVNPLDIHGEIVSYDPLPIPPHLIFRVAEIRNDWFVFSDDHRVHVPRRITQSETVSVRPSTATLTKHPRRNRTA